MANNSAHRSGGGLYFGVGAFLTAFKSSKDAWITSFYTKSLWMTGLCSLHCVLLDQFLHLLVSFVIGLLHCSVMLMFMHL